MEKYIRGDVSEVLLEADAYRRRQEHAEKGEQIGKALVLAYITFSAIALVYALVTFGA